jgi:hypothetical protein
MKTTIALLTLSAALISGCASTAPPPRAARTETFIGYVTPYTGRKARDTYKVTTEGLTSPQVQLARVDEGFRGVVWQMPIDLRVDKDAVTGSLSNQPIDLRIEHKGGTLSVEGLYGGRFAGFFFSDTPGAVTTGCSELQPWISISTTDTSEPASCAAETLGALALLRAHLDEGDTAALLAVMLLGGTSSSGGSRQPHAPVPTGGSGRPHAPTTGRHASNVAPPGLPAASSQTIASGWSESTASPKLGPSLL